MATRLKRENQCSFEQYLLKGTDLSVYRQEELNATADSLNTRSSSTLGWRTLLEAYVEMLKISAAGSSTPQ